MSFGIWSAGKLAIRIALFKSLMIAFLLYRFRTFDDQWTGNFLSLSLTSVVITSGTSWVSEIIVISKWCHLIICLFNCIFLFNENLCISIQYWRCILRKAFTNLFLNLLLFLSLYIDFTMEKLFTDLQIYIQTFVQIV